MRDLSIQASVYFHIDIYCFVIEIRLALLSCLSFSATINRRHYIDSSTGRRRFSISDTLDRPSFIRRSNTGRRQLV